MTLVPRRLHSHRLVGAAVVPLTVLALSAGPASADTPLTDPAARGTLTLCDVRNQVVDHGDTRTKPFVWRAVGSTAGSATYAATGRTAALYGYQPIKDVSAGRWVGDYLTASARYTNAARPMAAATAGDPSLADLLSAYPTKWDGLFQLRMFLGAPGSPTLDSSYDAATIRVSGTRWTLVSGGRSGCDSGTAESSELVLPEVRALGTPAPNATTTGPAAPSSGAKAGASRGVGSSPVGTPTAPGSGAVPVSTPAATAPDADAAAASSADDGGSGTTWLVVAVLVVALAGAAYAFRRRLGALLGR